MAMRNGEGYINPSSLLNSCSLQCRYLTSSSKPSDAVIMIGAFSGLFFETQTHKIMVLCSLQKQRVEKDMQSGPWSEMLNPKYTGYMDADVEKRQLRLKMQKRSGNAL